MKKIILITYVLFLSIAIMEAQETKASNKEKLHIALKDGVKPDIYVDGKKFDFPMDLLDVKKIESIKVLKGDLALKKYNTTNGVILIATKKDKIDGDMSTIVSKGDVSKKEKAPLIIINGKKSTQKNLSSLTPDDIKTIEVIKNDAAIKKHNAANGVIIVTTKK